MRPSNIIDKSRKLKMNTTFIENNQPLLNTVSKLP